MWRTGFPFAEREATYTDAAGLDLFRPHRGTHESRAGAGLARAGCRGAAFRVAEQDGPRLCDLLEREQPDRDYIEARRNVRMDDGRRVESCVHVGRP